MQIYMGARGIEPPTSPKSMDTLSNSLFLFLEPKNEEERERKKKRKKMSLLLTWLLDSPLVLITMTKFKE